MKVARRRLVRVGASLAVALAVAVGVLVALWPRRPPPVWPRSVPASWEQYRTSPGHTEHVLNRRIDCTSCHDVQREGFTNPGTAVCKSCHAKETGMLHRGGSGSDATGCLTCHAFAPDRPAATCISCHAQPHGASPAVVQHADVDCTKCHHVHESPSIMPADCAGCHDERATGHPAHEGSAGCRDCHQVHRPAAFAVTQCSSCHSQPAGPRPAGHASCTGCHQPHDFTANGASVCVGCHGEKPTLAAAAAPAHGICTNCHTPHDPAAAASACARCHADIQVDHGKQGACVGCHAPHPPQGDFSGEVALSTPCTTCHTKIAAFDTGAHAGGVACQACHKPHAFAQHDPRAVCVTCHASETSLAATNEGHRDCAACHGGSLAHAPERPPACGTCHAAELASAPAGHRRCEGCHDPHAGLPASACNTCHQAESAGIHGSVPGGCVTCHRPHGPQGVATTPACTTCHGAKDLPGLHAVAGHGVCSSCHVAPHEPPRSDRATCTSGCHADRRDHQPLATVCTGCHVFRR